MIRTATLASALLLAANAPALAAGVPTEAAPADAAKAEAAPFRTDEIVLSLEPMSNHEGSELEYMVRLPAGASLVYAWEVEGPEADVEFYVDFHGHTRLGQGFKVVNYRESEARTGYGALEAPFEGTHGWFFQNRSMHKAKLKLKLAGFYELRSIRDVVMEEESDHMPFGPPRPVG